MVQGSRERRQGKISFGMNIEEKVNWSEIYETAPVQKLKHIGHKLLDVYIALDNKRGGTNAVDYAYNKLGTKMNSMYGMHHFGKMKTRKEVVMAIVKLRRMIDSRKNKLQREKENRDATVFLPSDEMKKALAALKKNTKE